MSAAMLIALLAVAGATPGLDAALALEEEGRNDEAIAALDAVIARDPRATPALLERARIRLKLGRDLDVVERDLLTVRALAPGNPRGLYLWASLLEERGDRWYAILALENALQLRPEYEDARLRAIGLSLALGDLLKAELHARALAVQKPQAIPPRLQLAEVLERQGRLADAEAILVHALEKHPKSPLLTTRLAELCDRMGQAARAEKLRKTLEPARPPKMRDLKRSRR